MENKTMKSFDDMTGKSFLIRTVTYHCVGKISSVFADNFLRLESASWVADSGRFSEAIRTGELNEVEFVGEMYVNMASVVDFFPWNKELPTKTK